MAFNGELEHLPIIDIIQLLHATKKSGTLSVTGEKGECRLVFSEGLIVSANYLNGIVRIGRVLVRLKAVTPEVLDVALKAQATAGDDRKPLIATLMEMGKLTQEQAYQGLRKLVEMTVVELIDWQQGTFSLDTEPIFVTENANYRPEAMVQEIFLDAQAVLMDALRVYDEMKRDGGSSELIYSAEELEIDKASLEEPGGSPVTADDLGLGDLDSLETKIPKVFRALPSVPGDESNRRLVGKALPGAGEESRDRIIEFLARYGKHDGGPSERAGGLAGGILIHGTDELLNHAVTTIFQPEGMLVFTTDSAEEIGLILNRWLRRQIVPLVVLDQTEGTAGLRQDLVRRHPEAYVVELAATGEPATVLESYAGGVRAVIPKPPLQKREGDVEGFIRFLEVLEGYGKTYFDEPIRQGLRRLRNCARDILDLDNPPDISFTILKYAAALFGRAVTFVVRKDELLAERGIGIGGGTGEQAGILQYPIPLGGDGLLEKVIGEGKVFCDDVDDDVLAEHLYPHIGVPKKSKILLLPLRNRNQTLAVIYADFGDGDETPVPTDVLEVLASQAALAFENSIYKRKAGRSSRG